MNKLAPSILAADFKNLAKDIALVEKAGAQMLHVDVMDGNFVPSISFGMPVIKSIRTCTSLPFDVHLMVQEPIRYIEEFKKCGADSLTVHVEACADVEATLRSIRKAGLGVGLSINPETSVEKVYPYMHLVDMVLVMTVHPGFGGQAFIMETTEKMKTLRAYIETKKLDVDIQVDGGIYLHNLNIPLEAGANVIVAGTAIFTGDIEKNIKDFEEVLQK